LIPAVFTAETRASPSGVTNRAALIMALWPTKARRKRVRIRRFGLQDRNFGADFGRDVQRHSGNGVATGQKLSRQP
jgi:hypothetical protein